MKYIFKGVFALISVLACLSSCDEEQVKFNDPDYVMFSDSLSTFAVQNSTDYFNVYVGTTKAVDHDRTFGVEVVSKESNAIEGKHYVIESNSVTIKAGERAGAIRIRANFDSFEDTDSIGVTLRLINQDKIWSIYRDKAQVVFQKICPFDINVFTGYCRMRSDYFKEYLPGIEYRLIRTEKDPDDENGIIMKNFMYLNYDLKVKFSTKNPLEPLVTMDEQMLTTTGEAFFGAIWGDDILRMKFAPSYPSFFNVCQHFMVQYMTLYIKDVDTVGTFVNAIEWISKAEAKKMLQERSTSNGLPKGDELNK